MCTRWRVSCWRRSRTHNAKVAGIAASWLHRTVDDSEEKKLQRDGKSIRATGGWFSLNSLLELYEPGALATTIEVFGVMVIDRYGRRAQADRAGQDDYSRSKALDLLAERQSEIENPGPDFPSWASDRYELEPHPLDRFGWETDALPSFEGEPSATSSGSKVYWTQRPLEEFDREIQQAGSLRKAGLIHGVSRQAYTARYRKLGGKLRT